MTHEELKRLYLLLEELNEFFHQPQHFNDPKSIAAFAERTYPEIQAMYYDIVWNALPKDIQEQIKSG